MTPLVILDAGHGVETLGKRSPFGILREYEFVRYIANLMKNYLEKSGIEVILTCPTEHDVTLAQRVAIANKYVGTRKVIFISLHGNAFGTGADWTNPRGWEVFISAKGGERNIIANLVRKHSIPFLEVPDRGVKTASFYVLTKTNCPAILIEHGFYTNEIECNLMMTHEFRNKCAIANSKAVCEYFGIEFKGEVVSVPTTPIETPKLVEQPKPIEQPKVYTPKGNPEILKLQKTLNRLGFRGERNSILAEDGLNGPNTKHAVKTLQRVCGITADGSAGVNTWNCINLILAKPICNAKDRLGHKVAVRYIQWRLGLDIDGSFGPNTVNEVKKYQKNNKLSVDGSFGPASWSKLIG